MATPRLCVDSFIASMQVDLGPGNSGLRMSIPFGLVSASLAKKGLTLDQVLARTKTLAPPITVPVTANLADTISARGVFQVMEADPQAHERYFMTLTETGQLNVCYAQMMGSWQLASLSWQQLQKLKDSYVDALECHLL